MKHSINGWTKEVLDNLVDIGIGRTPSRAVSAFWGRGHTWLSISDMKGKWIATSKEQVSPLGASIMSAIPKGSLMMSFKLSIGKLAFAGCDLYTNEAICNFSKYNGVTPDYLYYALQKVDFSLYGKQAVKGYTLNKESLAKIELHIPPILEQKKIAAILSDIDELIEVQEAELAKLKNMKSAIMHKLLTGEIRLP